jgi:hypothetical protein
MGTRKRYLFLFLLALLGFGMLASCTPSTRLLASWHDPSYQAGALRRPLVLAVARQAAVRAKLEDELVRQLRAAGVDAMQSYKLVGDVENPDLVAKIKDQLPAAGRDSVLVTHLVDVKTEAVYVPTAEYGYGYPAYYGRLGSYYSHSYDLAAEPGYAYPIRTYELETNLYDASTDKLVWTVSTESEEPESLDAAVHDFATVVVKDIKERGLFG